MFFTCSVSTLSLLIRESFINKSTLYFHFYKSLTYITYHYLPKYSIRSIKFFLFYQHAISKPLPSAIPDDRMRFTSRSFLQFRRLADKVYLLLLQTKKSPPQLGKGSFCIEKVAATMIDFPPRTGWFKTVVHTSYLLRIFLIAKTIRKSSIDPASNARAMTSSLSQRNCNSL